MANGQLPMINVGGNLPPEILQQQQALNRQQQMAQLLMQQGQQMPSGQMVSGRYVAPSFFQYAAPLFQTYMGSRMAEKGDKAAVELAQKLREQQQKMGEQYFEALQGKPAVYGADIPTETYETVKGSMISPATGPDYRKAFSIATDPYAPSWLKAQAAEMLKPQKVGEGEKVFRFNPVTGKNEVVAEGGEKFRAPLQVDTGSRIEYRDPRDPTKILSVVPKSVGPAEAARLAYEGIPFGGGGGNVMLMPQGGGQVGQTTLPVANVDAKFVPSNLPKYEYDPSMSLADNRAAQVKFNERLRTNIGNAKESFGILSTAADVLSSNRPSSGFFSNVATTTGEAFGYGGEASQADATLKILGEKLTAQVPRFEGPQSDKDTAAYRTAAGDLGNANKPIATRIAAVKTMIELNKKYYPNGDWESIDIVGPVNRKYSPYLPTVVQDIGRAVTGEKANYSPQEFRKTLNERDQAAFDFVRRNPNHKDTPAIKKVLGIE